jgi:hypothetical protein
LALGTLQNKRGKILKEASFSFGKRRKSEIFCFESMNLSMFNRFCPGLKARVHLKERLDLSKGNEERYVIPMHRKNFWTNKWMQEPRKNFFQVQHYDPRGSVQYRKGWGTFKRKRGLTLCYDCRRSGHLAKEFLR